MSDWVQPYSQPHCKDSLCRTNFWDVRPVSRAQPNRRLASGAVARIFPLCELSPRHTRQSAKAPELRRPQSESGVQVGARDGVDLRGLASRTPITERGHWSRVHIIPRNGSSSPSLEEGICGRGRGGGVVRPLRRDLPGLEHSLDEGPNPR